ncbi:MAG TPA: hypothetical protein VGD65_10245 [Chryseosolibacter sp.]
MDSRKTIVIAHAAYILLTAIWPIVHIESFILVTGPKEDIWLVKTVGALLIPVGACLLACVAQPFRFPAFVLGAGTAVAFIVIDVHYALNDVISDIYLADALVEGIFLVGWIYVFAGDSKNVRP